MAVRARGRAPAVARAIYRRWLALWRCESGLSAVEYGLLVTLIALGLIVGAGALGGSLNTFFQDLADYFAGTGG